MKPYTDEQMLSIVKVCKLVDLGVPKRVYMKKLTSAGIDEKQIDDAIAYGKRKITIDSADDHVTMSSSISSGNFAGTPPIVSFVKDTSLNSQSVPEVDENAFDLANWEGQDKIKNRIAKESQRVRQLSRGREEAARQVQEEAERKHKEEEEALKALCLSQKIAEEQEEQEQLAKAKPEAEDAARVAAEAIAKVKAEAAVAARVAEEALARTKAEAEEATRVVEEKRLAEIARLMSEQVERNRREALHIKQELDEANRLENIRLAKEQAEREREATADKCEVCLKAVLKSYIAVGKKDELKTHPDCYQRYKEDHAELCLQCSGPVCKTDKFCGKFYSIDEKGKVHTECYPEYQVATADKCVVCNEAVTGQAYSVAEGFVHPDCYQRFRTTTADPCMECNGPLVAVPGQFDGRFYSVEGGGVHMECHQAYKLRTAVKCFHCSDPVMKIEGKYNGQFYEMEQGKLHKECLDDFEKKRN
jgi:hypothetical protein